MRSLLGLILLVPFLAFATSEPLLRERNDRPLDAEATASALLPWETPISGFFIRNHHEVPVVDADRWELVIDGLVEKPLKLRLSDLKRMSGHSLHAVLECSGNGRGLLKPAVPGIQWERGAVGNAEWGGVRLADVLAKARPKAEAKFARIEGADKPALPSVPGFVRSVPLGKLQDRDTLLAWTMNREPMPVLHGGPLRLVLPRWYGHNWIKWVTHITLEAQEDPGFYMKKGYRMPKEPVKPGETWDSATGVPVEQIRVQSILVSPRPDERVAVGDVDVRGKAFSGAGPVTAVMVSTNEGKTWQEADLEKPRPGAGWQEFRFKFTPARKGRYSVWSRATDTGGAVQPPESDWNPSGYLRNGIDKIEFEAVPAEQLEGARLVEAKCRTCHSLGIVYGQALSRGAWDKVVVKMEKVFGMKIEPAERETITAYLEKATVEKPVVPDADYTAQAVRFSPNDGRRSDTSRGKAIYTKQCASCHGPQGEGMNGFGPRLTARAVPKAEFDAIVRHGRAGMPAFEGILKPAEIQLVRAFVQKPAK